MVPETERWPAPAGSPGSSPPAGSGLVRGEWNGEGRYWLQTLGCPKNQVDSDKLDGHLAGRGVSCRADDPDEADLVVVNTCAFIEPARQESIDTVLTLADRRRPGARLVVTGCMAERYGDELADALPEVDLVAGFGVELRAAARCRPGRHPGPAAVPRPGSTCWSCPGPAATAPWAYVKVAEGCDRICGFCAIPSFRGKQRSRSIADILAEVDGSRRSAHRSCARSSWWPRTWPPTAATARARPADAHRHGPSPMRADPRRVGPGRAHPAAVPLSLRADRRV